MKKINFSVDINAPREKVWNVLWDDASYRSWTSVFSEGSHAETDWKEGSKVLFLNETGDGMVSKIAKKNEPEFMSFEHLGEVKNGVEEQKEWAGAHEDYMLKETNGITHLQVEMDSTAEFEEYFSKTFPKALEKVKELSEK